MSSHLGIAKNEMGPHSIPWSVSTLFVLRKFYPGVQTIQKHHVWKDDWSWIKFLCFINTCYWIYLRFELICFIYLLINYKIGPDIGCLSTWLPTMNLVHLQKQLTDMRSAEIECAQMLDPNAPPLERIWILDARLEAIVAKTKDTQVVEQHYEKLLKPMHEEKLIFACVRCLTLTHLCMVTTAPIIVFLSIWAQSLIQKHHFCCWLMLVIERQFQRSLARSLLKMYGWPIQTVMGWVM